MSRVFRVAMLHWTASIPGKVTTSSTRVGNIRNEFPVGTCCKEELSGPTSQGTAQSAVRQFQWEVEVGSRAWNFRMRVLDPVLLGGTVLLGGDGMPPQAGTPATITNLVRVDEVIGRFAAFGTFERHRPRHSANVQTMCTGTQFDPLPEHCCRVPLVQFARLLACKEKRPRTKEDHQPCRYYDRHNQYDHETTRTPSIPPTVSTVASRTRGKQPFF